MAYVTVPTKYDVYVDGKLIGYVAMGVSQRWHAVRQTRYSTHPTKNAAIAKLVRDAGKA